MGNKKANVFPVPVGDNNMVFAVFSITVMASICIGYKAAMFSFTSISCWFFISFAIMWFVYFARLRFVVVNSL
jgi:hypothetical protein